MVVKTVKSCDGLVVCTDDEMERYKQQSAGFTLEGILCAMSLLQNCLAEIKRGVNRRTETEMTFIKMSTPTLSTDSEAILSRISELELKLKTGSFTMPDSTPVKAAEIKKEEKAEPFKDPAAILSTAFDLPEAPAAPQSEPSFAADDDYERAYTPDPVPTPFISEEAPAQQEGTIQWAEVLSELMKTNMPLWGVLVNSQAVIKGDFVLIKSDNPTLNSFIKTGRNAKDVKDAIIRVTGKKYRLGVYNAAAQENPAQPQAPKKDPLENLISNARSMGINVDIKP
jgi:DNA polymerase III gamma/tau subunit